MLGGVVGNVLAGLDGAGNAIAAAGVSFSAARSFIQRDDQVQPPGVMTATGKKRSGSLGTNNGASLVLGGPPAAGGVHVSSSSTVAPTAPNSATNTMNHNEGSSC